MEESNTFQDDITINSMRSQIETPLGEEKSTIADKLEKLKRGKPKNYLNVLSYFRLFFNDEILDLFVEESNHYFTEILKDCEDTWHKQKSLEEQIEKYFEEKIPQSRGKFLSCEVNKTFLRVKLIIHKGDQLLK